MSSVSGVKNRVVSHMVFSSPRAQEMLGLKGSFAEVMNKPVNRADPFSRKDLSCQFCKSR